MKKTRILLVILALIIAVALLRQSYQLKAVEEEVKQIEISEQLPVGTPGNSAPLFALEACINKELGDECDLGEETGICSASGDRLACGPSN